MIQRSSKRLQKINKKLKKNDQSDYNFLLKSLERESNKQNNSSSINRINNRISLNTSTELIKSSMKNSYQITKNIQHNHSNNHNKIKLLKNNYGNFLSNSKNMLNSITHDEKKQKINQKLKNNYINNNELDRMSKVKWIQSQKIDKSNKFKDNSREQFQNKLQAYVEFVNEMFEDVINEKTIKQNKIGRKNCLIKNLGKQLLEESRNLHVRRYHQQVDVSHFSAYNSKNISRDGIIYCKEEYSSNFQKIIDSLATENNKLEQLISEHERKNIKMYIQMNENQSKQIQNCKSYLSKLYDKYKILQKLIMKQKQKYKRSKDQNKSLILKNIQFQSKIIELNKTIQNLKNLTKQNRSINSSKLSFEEDSTQTVIILNPANNHNKNNNNINNNNNKQIRNKREEDVNDKHFETKRQSNQKDQQNLLKIKKNNCNNDEQLLGFSTLTKSKRMKNKKQNVLKSGINLKQQFVNEHKKQDRLELLILRNELNRQIAQKLALRQSNEMMNSKVRKREEKFIRMQNLIKDQLNQIQKLMNKVKQLSVQLKKYDNMIHNTNNQSNKIVSQFLQLNQSNDVDEYRIIALQAAAIQKLII